MPAAIKKALQVIYEKGSKAKTKSAKLRFDSVLVLFQSQPRPGIDRSKRHIEISGCRWIYLEFKHFHG